MAQECLPVSNLLDANGLQLYCPDGQYNAAAQLGFNTLENTVKGLFHDPRGSFSVCFIRCISLCIFCRDV